MVLEGRGSTVRLSRKWGTGKAVHRAIAEKVSQVDVCCSSGEHLFFSLGLSERLP
jgi:hypothetical protein